MYNKVLILGNLTKDIEMRYTQGSTAIANSATASTRKFTARDGTQNEETLFVDIAFFGRTAEVANQYLHKGSRVLIEGKLKFDQWSDQNGQKRSKHSVSVENMQMLDSKNASTGAKENNQYSSKEQSASIDKNPFDDDNA